VNKPWIGALLAVNVWAQTAGASGSGAPQLQWNDEDRGAGWANVVLLGVTGSVALAAQIVEPTRGDPWQHTWGVDEQTRSALRLSDPSARRAARTTSDMLAAALVSYPIVVEAGLNVAWAKSSSRVGFEMGLMQLEVLGVTAALVGVSKVAFSRERPYGRLCGSELSATSEDCVVGDRYLSYFSGHAAFTFASASLTCFQHTRWDLWGNTPAWVPCATSYTLAATTALLRVAADRHYITDIATGAVVGTAVGLVVPWFHYRSPRQRDNNVAWSLGIVADGVGLHGVF
jgi:hypothetical protein